MPYPGTQKRRTTWLCLYPIQNERVRMQEARLAKEKMHGRLACGRPLVVRLASEKAQAETATENSGKTVGSSHKSTAFTGSSGQTSRTAKIAAIKNKLKALEDEGNKGKKQKQSDSMS